MEVLIVQGGDFDSKLNVRGGTSAIGQRGRGGERKRAPSFSRGIQRRLPKQRKERCDWNPTETTAFIKRWKEGGRFRKGKIVNWEAIADDCGSTRTKEECQNRSDTLMKAHRVVKNKYGSNYKQFFEITEEKRLVKLPTHLTLEWFEDLDQIKQQKQKKPRHLSSSGFGGPPSLGGRQTPSRSDLGSAEDAGSSDTDLISSPENSPSPDPTQFQDPAVAILTHSSELTDLLFQQMAQGPATPGVAQVVHPNLPDGEDSGAPWGLDHAPNDLPLSFGRFDQEVQDCDNFSAQYFCEDIALMRIEQYEESSSNLWDW